MYHNYAIHKIVELLDCRVFGNLDEKHVSHLCTDSRHINIAQNCLFIALKGERFDGHDYLNQCSQKGIQLFLISDDSVLNLTRTNHVYMVVDDTLEALQQIARFHRSQFNYPVIGITGSNGKTIIKEWLYQILQSSKVVVKSPKSYNSQIGVPLSVWNMTSQHELAIFEAGISLPAEMTKLQRIIQPTIGIFTNIGPAHDEGFQSMDEKIENKLQLFQTCEKIIYCKDHSDIDSYLAPKDNSISWGNNVSSQYQFTYDLQEENTEIQVKTPTDSWIFHTSFKDKISLENISHVIVSALEIGIAAEEIEEKLKLLHNLAMRMELKYGMDNCLIIDDSYSADMLSFEAGLNFLADQKGNLKPSLIISPFDQSGQTNEQQLLLLKQLLSKRNINKLIFIGSDSLSNSDFAGLASEIFTYDSTDNLIKDLSNISFYKEAILVKGGRKYQFEKIVKALQSKSHKTILEINLNKLIDNLNFYRSRINSGTKIIAMVKAHSYGSGSTEIAYTLQSNNVDYLAVAYADEGVVLRKNGVHVPIMVMNPSIEELDIMIQNNLEPSIYSVDLLSSFIALIKEKKVLNFKIHLKFETGMLRLGMDQKDIPKIIELLNGQNKIVIASIFSHLAAADDQLEKAFSEKQIERFEVIHESLTKAFGNLPKHILNSAGILAFPNANDDYVRLGIGLYGIDTTNTCQDKLEFISTLKTRIAQIKTVAAGESIGYGRSDFVSTERKIAVLAIGYADGYDRRFSNGKGKVYINGKFAPTIGRVCMDMTMVDLTEISDAKTGQFVEVFGPNVSIIEAAENIKTIPYELLTNISERVKRIYTWE